MSTGLPDMSEGSSGLLDASLPAWQEKQPFASGTPHVTTVDVPWQPLVNAHVEPVVSMVELSYVNPVPLTWFAALVIVVLSLVVWLWHVAQPIPACLAWLLRRGPAVT